jgi:hypothetical protein
MAPLFADSRAQVGRGATTAKARATLNSGGKEYKIYRPGFARNGTRWFKQLIPYRSANEP